MAKQDTRWASLAFWSKTCWLRRRSVSITRFTSRQISQHNLVHQKRYQTRLSHPIHHLIMAGILRVLTTLALLVTLVSESKEISKRLNFWCSFQALSAAALVLEAINTSKDDPNLHNTVHGLALSGTAFSVVTCLVGLALVLTRNMHRRFLTIIWLWHAFVAVIVMSAAWGIYAYLDAFDIIGTRQKVTMALLIASCVAMKITALHYAAKSMEEYAVGHK